MDFLDINDQIDKSNYVAVANLESTLSFKAGQIMLTKGKRSLCDFKYLLSRTVLESKLRGLTWSQGLL